jgi:hypothetical protein
VVAPRSGVEDAGARAEVVAGEVVLGVVADGPGTDAWCPPALAEEVGLLGGEPGPGVCLGAEDLGVTSPIRAAIPGAEATTRELVDRPERPLLHAATLTVVSECGSRSPLAGDAAGIHEGVWRRSLGAHILADFDVADPALGDEPPDESGPCPEVGASLRDAQKWIA